MPCLEPTCRQAFTRAPRHETERKQSPIISEFCNKKRVSHECQNSQARFFVVFDQIARIDAVELNRGASMTVNVDTASSGGGNGGRQRRVCAYRAIDTSQPALTEVRVLWRGAPDAGNRVATSTTMRTTASPVFYADWWLLRRRNANRSFPPISGRLLIDIQVASTTIVATPLTARGSAH